MNDHHMRFLADDRQRQLRAEAEQARLARLGHVSRRPLAAPSRGTGARQRQGWLHLGSLRARFGA